MTLLRVLVLVLGFGFLVWCFGFGTWFVWTAIRDSHEKAESDV